MGDVLAFFTGTDTLPPLGLEVGPTLNFSAINVFPTASTCAMILTLLTKYLTYPDFKEKFIYGMTNHGGFGLY